MSARSRVQFNITVLALVLFGSVYLGVLANVQAIVKQYGKRVVLDEAWLYKVDKPLPNSVAASPEIFRRDVFSFWAPLDQKFLAVIVKSAEVANIEYISPFWTQFFFGYVEYNSNTAQLSFRELSSMANQIASNNIIEDQFTSTGQFYRQMAGAPVSSSTASTTMSSGSGKIPGLGIGVLIAVVVIGVVALSVLRRRRRDTV